MILAILGPFHPHINFRISLSVSAKKTAGVLVVIAKNLYIILGRTDDFYSVEPSSP